MYREIWVTIYLSEPDSVVPELIRPFSAHQSIAIEGATDFHLLLAEKKTIPNS
jgi:hypothetical protein